MASKNSVKIYVEDSFYHIYNRGVEKRNIFEDQQDFSVFLSYLQTYLTPKDESGLGTILSSLKSSPGEKDRAIKLLRLKNYSRDVDLLCYALMPNHFHLLIRQSNIVLTSFMNSLGTRYSMYFNRKYKRTGVLFQDVYKAVRVQTEEQLLYLSQYINLNPAMWLGFPPKRWLDAPFPCSLPEYLNLRHTNWIKKEAILNFFSKTNPHNTYENFLGMELGAEIIADLAIDSE